MELVPSRRSTMPQQQRCSTTSVRADNATERSRWHLDILALTLVLSVATSAFAVPPIASNFDAGTDGWVVKDLNCNSYGTVLGTYTLDWFPTGGDPGGHVGRVDPTSNCYFFDAPAPFLGDRSAFVGAALRFSLRTTVNDWPPGSVLVLIGDGGKVLVNDFAQPDATWMKYTIALAATNFKLNTAAGAPVSAAQFAAVLADLEALRISAEYGSELGEETTFLDTVSFGGPICPGDLNLDGAVDGADLGLLLTAWGSADSVADLDFNGVVDGGDLGLLLGSWGPCP
ncbi:MAG: laminin B domain-containing protein [Phycisphaerales bacterium]